MTVTKTYIENCAAQWLEDGGTAYPPVNMINFKHKTTTERLLFSYKYLVLLILILYKFSMGCTFLVRSKNFLLKNLTRPLPDYFYKLEVVGKKEISGNELLRTSAYRETLFPDIYKNKL